MTRQAFRLTGAHQFDWSEGFFFAKREFKSEIDFTPLLQAVCKLRSAKTVNYDYSERYHLLARPACMMVVEKMLKFVTLRLAECLALSIELYRGLLSTMVWRIEDLNQHCS